MKLTQLRISNFQSFGAAPTTVQLDAMSFLIGGNGTGKTAVLQALARLFAFDPALRRVRSTDFHRTKDEIAKGKLQHSLLWIEAQFEFAELATLSGKHATIPVHFAHMQLESADGLPRIRFRLTAQIDEEGGIEETLTYVLQVDDNENPLREIPVQKHDRASIQMYYLPARRDPSDHISYATNSLLGRVLRAADWQEERDTIAELTSSISKVLAANGAIGGIDQHLSAHWKTLHRGTYFAHPHVSFERNEIDSLLRHLTVGFSPGPAERIVDFSRLSDGQQSLLYISLVLSVQALGRQVLAGELPRFDPVKLRPAVFTLLAVEEPENSLSPHCLGRIINMLTAFSGQHDAQTIVATHAPAMLRRVPPENIRYLRLNADRQTIIATIALPDEADEAHKFVREAVQAFPELYFSRLIILGEGDSEVVVLPRLLRARGIAGDDASICVVPLGGRHVNHFWRLLHCLGIPHVTLLDLDLGRHQGGWGRIKYAGKQLLKYTPTIFGITEQELDALPGWDDTEGFLAAGQEWLERLEVAGVFFSAVLDLDLAMLRQFPSAFGVANDELEDPNDSMLVAVLGKNHGSVAQYSTSEKRLFGAYHRRFKLGSKPVAHLEALAKLNDTALQAGIPTSIARLFDLVKMRLAELPE